MRNEKVWKECLMSGERDGNYETNVEQMWPAYISLMAIKKEV